MQSLIQLSKKAILPAVSFAEENGIHIVTQYTIYNIYCVYISTAAAKESDEICDENPVASFRKTGIYMETQYFFNDVYDYQLLVIMHLRSDKFGKEYRRLRSYEADSEKKPVGAGSNEDGCCTKHPSRHIYVFLSLFILSISSIHSPVNLSLLSIDIILYQHAYTHIL